MGQQQSEKSVLSRGLKVVPISKKADEFSVKQDLEKFLRRVQLKAFFHDKEDDSNTSNKDTFETLQIRKSKWTPPEGQFASLDFSIKKCRHSINKRKFSPSSLLELRVFTFYLKSTNLTTQVDPSFLPAVVPPNLFTAIQTKSCTYHKNFTIYIQDRQRALEIFRDFNFLGQNKFIFTTDITSLYTVIPNDEGLRALKHFFDQRMVKKPSS